MSAHLLAPPQKHQILIVDDEPGIHKVTRLSLRDLRYRDREVVFLSAETGSEAVAIMRANPMVSVILLDVVMENDSAGLEACRLIREELGNHLVRILLRTGQPGMAPELDTINDYDIDGYLEKGALTSNRLYSAVRTALKAWEQLVDLERHRTLLATIHDCTIGLHADEPLSDSLARILEGAVTLCPSPLAVLSLETFEVEGVDELLSDCSLVVDDENSRRSHDVLSIRPAGVGHGLKSK